MTERDWLCATLLDLERAAPYSDEIEKRLQDVIASPEINRARRQRFAPLVAALAVLVIAIAVSVATSSRSREKPGGGPSTTSPPTAATTNTVSGSAEQPGGYPGPISPTATITAVPAKPATAASADYSGSGTAHGCETAGNGQIITIVLNPDGAAPLCIRVRASQRLRIVNSMIAVLHGQAREAHISARGLPVVTIPVGQALLIDRPVGDYLSPGQHFIQYTSDGGTFDIWLQ